MKCYIPIAGITKSAIQNAKSHLERGQFHGNCIYLSAYIIYYIRCVAYTVSISL